MPFLMLPLLTLLFAGSFFLGGNWLVASIVLVWLVAVPLDETVGDDWSTKSRKGTFLTAILYLQLPTLAAATFFFAYYLSDWTFLGEAINQARLATRPWQVFVVGISLGVFYGVAGINVAHELVHRPSRPAVTVGRWLLSFSFDTGFSLEHVYGHHLHVATGRDPATARRGQGFWSFFGRMVTRANANAWEIEKRFLKKRNQSVFSHHNRFLRGQLMSLAWVALFFAADGFEGVLVFLLLALNGKIYLELTNYIEHYGLVRAPGTRVSERHSWNSGRRVSNWLLFNLPRHSDHHMRPLRPYWELDSRRDAPQLPYGYFLMAALATVPPLFRRRMKPLLERWDEEFATPEERDLAAAQENSTPAAPARRSA